MSSTFYLHRKGVLDSAEQASARAVVGKAAGALRQSQVYDGEAEVLSRRRQSKQCSLRAEPVFECGRTALRRLCPYVAAKLRIIRGHADLVVSEVGDYFEAHRDFALICGSAGEHTLTLIICLDAPLAGGELLLFTDTLSEVGLRYTAGSATLFSCAIAHKANRVAAGTKRVLKFDVVAEEDLWKVVTAPGPSNPECADALLPVATLECIDALNANKRFNQDTGTTHTELLQFRELDLLVRFHQGKAVTAADVPLLYETLSRLSCPEAQLPLESVAALNSGRAVALPSEADATRFMGRSSALSVLFVACSHRRHMYSWVEQGGLRPAPAERPQCFCATDLSGVAVFKEDDFGRSPEFFQLAAHDVEQISKRVFAHAIKMIELYDEEYADGADRTRAFWDTRAPRADSAAASACTDLVAAAERAVLALCKHRPASEIVSSESHMSECNDGDTYRSVSYETTLLRRGYVLVSCAA